jgi:hypothetical protein
MVDMKKREPVNLLKMRLVRRFGWEADPEGRAVVLVPKFRQPLLVRWLLPLLARPHFRVRLDDFGTFVWQRCDGTMPVLQIAEEIAAAFGERAEPLYERLGRFVRRLERDGLVEVIPNTSPQPAVGDRGIGP